MDSIQAMRTMLMVVDQGSFTAAAERLDLSTALVSKYVRQLEQQLGARLLNRTTRSMHLTETGQAYVERARQLLAEFDELEAAIQDRQAAPRGTIRLSAPVSFGELCLAPILADYLRQYPEVSIELHLTDRFVNLIEEGVDLAVRIARLEDSSMIARRLSATRVVVCASPDYLTANGAPEAPPDLGRHPCILDRNFRTPSRWPFVQDGALFEVEVSGRFSVNGARCARTIALAGAGIARIPSYAIEADLAEGRLIELFADLAPEELGIYAIYPQHRYLAAKVRMLIDLVGLRLGEQAGRG